MIHRGLSCIVLLLTAGVGTGEAGRRCIRRPTTAVPAPLPKIEKPTLAQVRTAVQIDTFVFGGEVAYALTYTGGSDADRADCTRTLGPEGTAADIATRAAMQRCIQLSRAAITTAKRGTWKQITRATVPRDLKSLVGNPADYGCDHLVVSAVTDSKRAKEGDTDYYVVYVAHREDEVIVIDAVYTHERIWVK